MIRWHVAFNGTTVELDAVTAESARKAARAVLRDFPMLISLRKDSSHEKG